MCDPLTIAGLTLSAAGTMYGQHQQAKNAKRVAGAVNDVTADNFARQDVLGNEARTQFGDVLAKFDPSKQADNETRAQTKREGLSDAAIAQVNPYAPTSGSAPSIVKNEVARKVAEAGDSARAQGARGAKISSFGDVLFGMGRNLDESRSRIGETGGFARGTAALLPIERSSAAANAFKAPGPLGDLLKLGGLGATLYGVGGGGPGWGDLFGKGSTLTAPSNAAWATLPAYA